MAGFFDAARRSALSGCLLAVGVFAQGPQISSITPSSAPIAGGVEISIRGANFAGAQLTLDGSSIGLSFAATDELRFTAPKHDNGYAVLRVSTAAGAATTTFLYVPPPLEELPPGYITTIAGAGNYFGDYGPAQEAMVAPWGVAYGVDGRLYIGEPGHNRVVRIASDGTLEPFAGALVSDISAASGDGGPALNATISFPRDFVIEANGDVIIPDSNHRIRRVTAQTGIISTIAGNGRAGFSGDGSDASKAVLNTPSHITGDGHGTVWFIDYGNARIRRITPDGRIDTICGNGQFGFSGDGGPATQASFSLASNDFGALAYDSGGFLYLADQDNRRIRRIDLKTGVIDTFIGPNRNYGSSLRDLRSLFVASGGDLYFFAAQEIIHVTRDGALVERFGVTNSNTPTFDNTPIAKVRLGLVLGIAQDPQGNIVFTDATILRVMRMNRSSGLVENVAGIVPAVYGQDRGALAANLEVSDITLLPSGEMLAADVVRVLKIGRDGSISAFAGTGTFSGPQDNAPAISAPWGGPSLELAPDGTIYMATSTHVVRIDPQGIVHRFAGIGDGGCAYSGDGGPALAAGMCQPWDAIRDPNGNVIIADTNNNRIRRVDAQTGIITTIAGSGPVNGYERYNAGTYCGDGGPAVQACLNTPFGLVLNSVGELFISDFGNGRIRKVDRNGNISTLAQMGGASYMAVDAADNLYMGSGGGVFRVTPTGNVQSFAAPGFGFSGDGGPVQQALVSTHCCGAVSGILIDPEGNLIFTDGGNRRIRAIRYGAVMAPPGARAQTTAGTPQSTPIGTRFSNALAVYVSDGAGNPAGNVRTDFDAPASGASCLFANGQTHTSALTDRNGSASAACTANTAPGAFTVTAAPMGTNLSLKFALTNTAPALASNSIVNAASFLSGPIAPGEILTIFGAGVGPPQLAQAAPGADGRYTTLFSGVRVRFNGVEAPVLFARFDQVGVIAPYALDGAASAQVVVEYAGVASNTITVPVAPSAPAIFTANATGQGQGAVLNQDGSANSASNPADRGSVVVLYCTGEGQTNPPGVDGKLASDVFPTPKLPVTVSIGGQPADVIYAGAAPTLVAGVLQINARVPASIAPGAVVPVSVTAGNGGSPAAVTIAVR